MVIKSGGKEHKTITENHFGVTGGDVVGYAGSKDKATMLLDVKDANNIDINTGDSSVHIVRIKTDKELTVLGGSAIDDELVTGSPKDNGDAQPFGKMVKLSTKTASTIAVLNHQTMLFLQFMLTTRLENLTAEMIN